MDWSDCLAGLDFSLATGPDLLLVFQLILCSYLNIRIEVVEYEVSRYGNRIMRRQDLLLSGTCDYHWSHYGLFAILRCPIIKCVIHPSFHVSYIY